MHEATLRDVVLHYAIPAMRGVVSASAPPHPARLAAAFNAACAYLCDALQSAESEPTLAVWPPSEFQADDVRSRVLQGLHLEHVEGGAALVHKRSGRDSTSSSSALVTKLCPVPPRGWRSGARAQAVRDWLASALLPGFPATLAPEAVREAADMATWLPREVVVLARLLPQEVEQAAADYNPRLAGLVNEPQLMRMPSQPLLTAVQLCAQYIRVLYGATADPASAQEQVQVSLGAVPQDAIHIPMAVPPMAVPVACAVAKVLSDWTRHVDMQGMA